MIHNKQYTVKHITRWKSIQTALALTLIFTITITALRTRPTFGTAGKRELLLRFKPGTGEHSKTQVLTSLAIEVVDEIPQIKVLVGLVSQNAFPHVKYALSHNPVIDFVEENLNVPISEIPNDKYYGLQWHLSNIKASEAWNITKGDPRIMLAILDTGVDPNHPDLANKLLQGYNAYDDSNNTADDLGHGTLVAGTAGASTNNIIGISAIGWKTPILPIKVNYPGQGASSYSLLAKGLIYGADKGAKVASMSWQIFNGTTLTSAAKYFRDRGGIVFAAAGNTGQNEDYMDNPYIFSVTATNKSDLIAPFSSYGPYVDIAAPGVGIFTTIIGKQATSYDYAYGYASGTSLSTPLTAGLAALIFSANPSLTPSQVEQILKSTAVDLGNPGYDIYYGWGRINALKALKEAAYTTPPKDSAPPTATITWPSNGAIVSGGITVTVNACDDTAISKVELYKDSLLFAIDSNAPYEFYWDTNNDPEGTHTLLAKAYDLSNNVGESNSVSVSIANKAKDTTPPNINIINPQNRSIVYGTIYIQSSAWDNSGISKIEFYIDNKLKATDVEYPYAYQWNTKIVKNGWHWILVKAYDSFGNCAEAKTTTYVFNKK